MYSNTMHFAKYIARQVLSSISDTGRYRCRLVLRSGLIRALLSRSARHCPLDPCESPHIEIAHIGERIEIAYLRTKVNSISREMIREWNQEYQSHAEIFTWRHIEGNYTAEKCGRFRVNSEYHNLSDEQASRSECWNVLFIVPET